MITDPVAPDRGGSKSDFHNFPLFMAELKSALGSKGLTATLPTSYWYLRGFDIINLADSVDWFNFMSYDSKQGSPAVDQDSADRISSWHVGR